jgi:hypothetical protein
VDKELQIKQLEARIKKLKSLKAQEGKAYGMAKSSGQKASSARYVKVKENLEKAEAELIELITKD